MEFLIVILLLCVFGLFMSVATQKQRIESLEQRLDALAGQVRYERDAGTAPYETGWRPSGQREPEQPAGIFDSRPGASLVDPAPVVPDEHVAEPEETAPIEPRETLGGLFERLVAGRLLIWLGGIALVLAAIFLIRYSIEVGLITPAARMAGAGVFGLALLAAGEWARAGRFADDPRIAQALVGAGVAVLYATVYGTHVLYALIDSRAAFAGMAAVTVAALGLSLRHGVPTAVMGLVGGFLTPLLVGSQNQSAAPLLVYLALLDFALFALAWKRGWTWLAAAATVLSFLWTFYVIADRAAGDALLAGIFIAALALLASLFRPGAGRQLAAVQPLAVGLLQLAILVGRTDMGLPAWGLFGVLSVAAIVLAALRREHWPAPPAALVFALLLIAVKGLTRTDALVPGAAVFVSLLFGGAGLALARRAPVILWTLLGVAGLAGPWLVLRLLRPDYLEQAQWGGLAAALALGPALLAWLHRKRADREAPADHALLAGGGGFALLAGAGVLDLVARDWVAAGWLGIALALALAARRLGDLALGTVALVAMLCGVARALWTVAELSTVSFDALLGWPVLAAGLPDGLRTLAALAVPALLLAAIRAALPPLPLRGLRALPILAGAFAVTALYIWFKQAFGLAGGADFVQRGLVERTLITQALFLLGWLAATIRRPAWLSAETMELAGRLLTAVAAARLLWFDVLLFNPVYTEQWVGPLPVLNLILAEYLPGAVWLYLARRRAGERPGAWPWFAGFLIALIAGTALLVRQYYHGAILFPAEVSVPNEAYGYSLAFLALSIGMIVAGVRLTDKALRIAGLVLLTATIVKVFLVDAAALTGVLRILSFLVLGIALIGIGRLYGPILRAEAEKG